MNAKRIVLTSVIAMAAIGLAFSASVAATNEGNNNPGENNTLLQGDQPGEGGGNGDSNGNNNPGENNTNLPGNQPKDS